MLEPNLFETLAATDLMKLSDIPFRLGGHDAVYVGLTATIYFVRSAGESIDAKICECMDEYIGLAPFAPRFAGLPLSRQWIDLTKRGYVAPEKAIVGLDPRQGWSADYVWSSGEDDAFPWSLQVLRGRPAETYGLNYVHATFPMAWAGDAKLPQLVKRWCERVNVLHGYVGIGPIFPASTTAERRSEEDVFFATKRYPGLNLDIPVSQSLYLTKGIKTVDWLTLLGDRYLTVLGGAASLGEELGAEFGLTGLEGGGVMIQAGALPELGDMKQGKRPALYVKLNRELRSIRVADYPSSFQSGQFTPNYMNKEAARAWIARLD